MKNIRDFNVKGKRVLVRCDFNVPVDEMGNISDDFRIAKSMPTIEYLIKAGAKTILMSHLDPENQGVVSQKYTLDGVTRVLTQRLSRTVQKASDCIGDAVATQVNNLQEGEVLLLENLRFHKEETANDASFGKQLASLGDIYINDAFSVSHRAHASVVQIPKFLPNGSGLLLQKEIDNLDKVLKNPTKPLVAIIGGVKIETRIKLIERISKIADAVIVSGLIKKGLKEKKFWYKFFMPKNILGPSKNLTALDVDPKTLEIFRAVILSAKTILWNGPFGKFEDEQYKNGTLSIAKAVIESGAFSVVGGGETIEFLDKEGIIQDFGHVSTGGGAMLSYLAGEPLPGIKALQQYATKS